MRLEFWQFIICNQRKFLMKEFFNWISILYINSLPSLWVVDIDVLVFVLSMQTLWPLIRLNWLLVFWSFIQTPLPLGILHSLPDIQLVCMNSVALRGLYRLPGFWVAYKDLDLVLSSSM